MMRKHQQPPKWLRISMDLYMAIIITIVIGVYCGSGGVWGLLILVPMLTMVNVILVNDISDRKSLHLKTE